MSVDLEVKVSQNESSNKTVYEGSIYDHEAFEHLVDWRKVDPENRAYVISCTPKGHSVTIGDRTLSVELEAVPQLCHAIKAALAAAAVAIEDPTTQTDSDEDAE